MPGIDTELPFHPLGMAVLTISDTRSLATDTSGALLADRLVRGGRSPLRVFGLCQLALALLTGFAIAAVPQLPRLIVMLHGAPVTIPHEVSVLMIVSSLLGLLYLAPVALRGLLPPQGEIASRGFIRPGGAPGVRRRT